LRLREVVAVSVWLKMVAPPDPPRPKRSNKALVHGLAFAPDRAVNHGQNGAIGRKPDFTLLKRDEVRFVRILSLPDSLRILQA